MFLKLIQLKISFIKKSKTDFLGEKLTSHKIKQADKPSGAQECAAPRVLNAFSENLEKVSINSSDAVQWMQPIESMQGKQWSGVSKPSDQSKKVNTRAETREKSRQ